MKTLHFSVLINAQKEKVWRVMLDHEGYKAWSAEFAVGSYYEGSWEKGEKIKFLTPDGSGMTSVIVENIPFEFISIKHLGYIKDGIENTESPENKAWVPSFESYTFSEDHGSTELKIAVDITPEFEKFMRHAWPRALAKLKMLCESLLI